MLKQTMPYKLLRNLPASVKDNLPKHAQEIYKETYNSAWVEYRDSRKRDKGSDREETAHKVAWSAVKKSYHKNQKGNWVKN